MVAPVYYLVRGWSRDAWSVHLWMICAAAGAIPLGYSVARISRPVLKTLLLCLATAGMLGTLMMLSGTLFRHEMLPAAAASGSSRSPWFVGFRSFLLYVPVCFVLEEVFFRGGLDSYLDRPGDRAPWLSAAFVSVLWGLWHLPSVIARIPSAPSSVGNPVVVFVILLGSVTILPLVHCVIGIPSRLPGGGADYCLSPPWCMRLSTPSGMDSSAGIETIPHVPTAHPFFGYSEIGYECLNFLLERGDNVVGLFTHEDNPNEKIWFKTPAVAAKAKGVPIFTPEKIATPEWLEKIAALKPDLILSVYYRNMISTKILALPPLGAFNMHGSLLPKYRGRAPINWAVLHGETRIGVTLHRMVKAPDAGAIVDQEGVDIGPRDTAEEAFRKVLPCARRVIARQIDALLKGTARETPQDEAQVTYFGGR